MLIALNGPPRSGKTTFSGFLLDALKAIHPRPWVESLEIARPFKQATNLLIGRPIPDCDKDEPLPELDGKTARDMNIALANLGESFSETIWVRAAMRDYDSNGVSVLDALGKRSQLKYLTDHMPPSELLIVRMVREGAVWSDGREPVEPLPAGYQLVVICNDRGLPWLKLMAKVKAQQIIHDMGDQWQD